MTDYYHLKLVGLFFNYVGSACTLVNQCTRP